MQNDYSLNPIPLRDEVTEGYEKATWKPTWKCFCCHDNGIIPERIVKTVIKTFVAGKHKPVKCNATGCNIRLGDELYNTNTLDLRFSVEICDRLSAAEKQMWKDWSSQKHEMRKLRILDSTKNLRVKERSNSEQYMAQQKHSNVVNFRSR